MVGEEKSYVLGEIYMVGEEKLHDKEGKERVMCW